MTSDKLTTPEDTSGRPAIAHLLGMIEGGSRYITDMEAAGHIRWSGRPRRDFDRTGRGGAAVMTSTDTPAGRMLTDHDEADGCSTACRREVSPMRTLEYVAIAAASSALVSVVGAVVMGLVDARRRRHREPDELQRPVL